MNKNELKKILKPLIKECIREALFEEKGALSHIISEVANGLTTTNNVVKEARAQPIKESRKRNKGLARRRKQLLDAIGKDAYGGVNVFEGVTPTPAASAASGQGPLSGVSPGDAGVDISNVFGDKSTMIFQRMMEKK